MRTAFAHTSSELRMRIFSSLCILPRKISMACAPGQFHQGPTHGRASSTSCLEKMLYGEIYSDSKRRASNLLAFSSQPIRNQPELLLAGFWLAERKMQEDYLLCVRSRSKFHRITFFLSMMGCKSLVTPKTCRRKCTGAAQTACTFCSPYILLYKISMAFAPWLRKPHAHF